MGWLIHNAKVNNANSLTAIEAGQSFNVGSWGNCVPKDG
jgi:hypothetical protein